MKVFEMKSSATVRMGVNRNSLFARSSILPAERLRYQASIPAGIIPRDELPIADAWTILCMDANFRI
jgi:hypothetical protein